MKVHGIYPINKSSRPALPLPLPPSPCLLRLSSFPPLILPSSLSVPLSSISSALSLSLSTTLLSPRFPLALLSPSPSSLLSPNSVVTQFATRCYSFAKHMIMFGSTIEALGDRHLLSLAEFLHLH